MRQSKFRDSKHLKDIRAESALDVGQIDLIEVLADSGDMSE